MSGLDCIKEEWAALNSSLLFFYFLPFRYASDLEEVLIHYRDKLLVSNLTETRQRALVVFSNLDEIHSFHAGCLWPELERSAITNCCTIAY